MGRSEPPPLLAPQRSASAGGRERRKLRASLRARQSIPAHRGTPSRLPRRYGRAILLRRRKLRPQDPHLDRRPVDVRSPGAHMRVTTAPLRSSRRVTKTCARSVIASAPPWRAVDASGCGETTPPPACIRLRGGALAQPTAWRAGIRIPGAMPNLRHSAVPEYPSGRGTSLSGPRRQSPSGGASCRDCVTSPTL